MLQVLHGLERLVRRHPRAADMVHDLGAQLGHDLGLLGEFVEEPGQRAGGGVAAGEQDGNELVAQDFAVTGVFGQGVEEGVAFVGFGAFL